MKKGFFKENIVAFGIALVISLGFVFMINRIDVLKADIMKGDDSKNQQSKSLSDLNVNFGNNSFAVTSSKDIQNISTLSFILVYDQAKLKISSENIDSKYDFTAANAGEGKLNAIVSLNSIQSGSNLLNVKFTGDQSVINISDAIVTFTDGTSEGLSISSK